MDRTTLLSFLMIWLIMLNLTAEYRAEAKCRYGPGRKRIGVRNCGRKRTKTNANLDEEFSSLNDAR